MAVPILYLALLLSSSISLAAGHSPQRLHYFETLKERDIQSRVHRSIDENPQAHLKKVSMKVLGREFRMYLKQASVLAPDFKATVVHSDGSTSDMEVDETEFYSGKLEGLDDSQISAYWEDGSMMARIATDEDVYFVEPSWRHLPLSVNHTMIAYRQSDIKYDTKDDHSEHGPKLCDGIHVDTPDDELTSFNYSEADQSDISINHLDPKRGKRQAVSPWLADHKSCRLMVVADYTFLDGIGGGYLHRTTNYVIGLINTVNAIYRPTKFDDQGTTGVGVEISEMRIHDGPSNVAGQNHYNMKKAHWDTRDLLTEFSSDVYFRGFCLAHLFTYRAFDKGVLGLAYIASARRGAVGGMCSIGYTKNGRRLHLNTGWSSSMNTAGNRILSQEATLVTAHEIGHNWGTEHDQDTDECAPSSFHGGKYIMYPFAVSGYERNNKFFSPCSRRYMLNVMKTKGYNCFTERRDDIAFCGNGRVDKGEHCDGGFLTKNGTDRCCSKRCLFRLGAMCSPANSECCTDFCLTAPETTLCRREVEDDGTCEGNAYCNGRDHHCQAPQMKADKTKCLDNGKCYGGECFNFCELQLPQKSLVPCICGDSTGNACYRCCKRKGANDTECTAYGETLSNGRPCYQGACQSGICEKQTQNLVQRLFDIIESITPSKFVAFMRSNIVGTVLVISIIVWIPASCVFSYFDKKNERKEEKKVNWLSRSNHTLFLEEDTRNHNIRVKNTQNRKLKQRPPKGSVVRTMNIQPTFHGNDESSEDRESAV